MSNINPNLPTPTINAETYYDAGSQQLNLFITYPSSVSHWPNDIIVNLITPPSTTPVKYGDGAPIFPANSNTGKMVMALPSGSAPEGGQVTVASLDASWDSSTPSAPWKFPVINLSPITNPASANFTSLGSVEVNWTWIAGMGATAQQVALIIKGQSLITTMVPNTGPVGTATFTMAQANNLFTPGNEITIQCIAISPGLWASPVDTTFFIPLLSRMWSFPFNNSPTVSSDCKMTSLRNPPMSIAWYGTPQGAIETVGIPNGNTEQFAAPTTIADSGSSITSIFINNMYQQVWWITEVGAIDGKISSSQGWISPGTGPGEEIPFNTAKIASTTNGGSLASLALEDTVGAILFWVNPSNGISCCRWLNSSGWGAVFDALPSGIASPTSQLSVLSVGNSAYLFCVGPGGAVVGASWSNASSDRLGQMSQFAVPSSGRAAPGGGLTSFSVSPQEIAVLWTSLKNNIEMALVFPGAPSNNIQRSLTLPQSVLGGTSIAACSTGENQWSIWWIGQSSDLRRTNVDLTNLALTPDYPVFEVLGPGSCKQTRSLIVQGGSGAPIDVLYVSASGALAGFSCTT